MVISVEDRTIHFVWDQLQFLNNKKKFLQNKKIGYILIYSLIDNISNFTTMGNKIMLELLPGSSGRILHSACWRRNDVASAIQNRALQ